MWYNSTSLACNPCRRSVTRTHTMVITARRRSILLREANKTTASSAAESTPTSSSFARARRPTTPSLFVSWGLFWLHKVVAHNLGRAQGTGYTALKLGMVRLLHRLTNQTQQYPSTTASWCDIIKLSSYPTIMQNGTPCSKRAQTSDPPARQMLRLTIYARVAGPHRARLTS